jgi:hypothetical protein
MWGGRPCPWCVFGEIHDARQWGRADADVRATIARGSADGDVRATIDPDEMHAISETGY